MGREFELKYQADEQVLARVEAAFSGFRIIRMQTTYYDNSSGDLRRLRWTLRHRMENSEHICTVKTSLPDGSRGEWEVVCPDILSAIPLLIAQGAPPALEQYAAEGLHRCCGARFTRKAALVDIPGGQVELALDQGVLLGSSETLPFAEIEVEQKSGCDQATAQFAESLARRFSLSPQPLSKLARAMALA